MALQQMMTTLDLQSLQTDRYNMNMQTSSMVVNPIIILITLLPCLIARQWIGPQTKHRIPPPSVLDG